MFRFRRVHSHTQFIVTAITKNIKLKTTILSPNGDLDIKTNNSIMNHATNNNSISSKNFCLPRLAFHLSARKQNSNQEAPLTKAEREIKKILSQVSRDTVVGQQILAGLSGDNTRFRILLSEFKDQVKDAEKHLTSVIGKRAVDLLKTIS